MKRVLSLLLAVCMVVTMSAPAFAAAEPPEMQPPVSQITEVIPASPAEQEETSSEPEEDASADQNGQEPQEDAELSQPEASDEEQNDSPDSVPAGQNPEEDKLPDADKNESASQSEEDDGEFAESDAVVQSEPASDAKVWYTLHNNGGGGHGYGQSGGPVTALYQGAPGKEDNVLSLDLRTTTDVDNFGIFYYYQQDGEWLYVGHDAQSGWYYQWKHAGSEEYPKLSGLPAPVKGETMNISISLGREVLKVSVNGVSVATNNQNLTALSESLKEKDVKFGVMTKRDPKLAETEVEFANVMLNGEKLNGEWSLLVPGNGTLEKREVALRSVTGTVVDAEGQPMADVTVRTAGNSVVTDEKGVFTLTGLESGHYSLSASKPGYLAASTEFDVASEDVTLPVLTMHMKGELDLSQYDFIENDSMKVYLGKSFPVVARYEVKTEGESLVFAAQEQQLDTIAINGKAIKTTLLESSEVNGSAAAKTYKLAVKGGNQTDLTMTVKISIEGTSLTWQVTEISKNKGCGPVDTIEVPGLNLLTISDYDAVRADETQKPYVGFDGALRSTDTTAHGDVHIGFSKDGGFVPNEQAQYLYGFLSNGRLSAGLFSNSEAEKDNRVVRVNSADSISLTSAPWYYEHGDKGGQAYAKNHADEDLTFPKSDLPVAKVSLAVDLNDDGIINWNDGAIAFRDIYNVPMGSENVKDMLNHRIVMNFASQAPNPFLETADNIKKVYLATDGMPQTVILKGYGNEGHDSANSEYGDIAVREGGVEDFQELIKIAHKYNTEVGIHVNAQEIYPEAKSMSNRIVGFPNVGNGWGWLDQSHTIDKIWDLTSDARWKRLVQLYDRINGTQFLSPEGTWPNPAVNSTTVPTLEQVAADAANRPDNMDVIYLDVWYQDSWETRQIAKQFNSLGWRFSTEFSDQGEYDSTWQHWATDATYGGKGMKGFNSDIIRFIRNDQRDSQVLNYPQFGGTADNPLLGGYRLGGFEGWVGDQDFNAYLDRTYTDNMPTRFLQQYQVIKWENYPGDTSPVGNHEKEITLRNDAGDIVVVSRNEKQRSDDIIERTITLNGVKVLEDDAYLLPWKDYQGEQAKLYHWNVDGGATSWELTGEFAGADSLIMYQLTDQGRVNPVTVPVVDNHVTLDVPAKTAYVLVREAGVKGLEADFGEGDYVTDPGFNGYTEGEQLDAADWTGTIDNKSVQVKHNVNGDQNLVFGAADSDVAVSTEIHGLTPGEEYVAEIYVDNKSDSRATVSVDTGSVTESNYTYRSIAGNYVRCDEHHLSNNKYDSKMQWIQVPFTAESDKATFTLSREAGDGEIFWDDIRIVKIALDNFKEDGTFVQDFESVTHGLYPFVLGPAQGVDDPATHLSQLNDPYTQSGWHTKLLDDVIDGEWSLKHHNRNTGIIYQTIPQNFRFEPGKAYEVTYDYQSGPNNAYAMVVGEGGSYTMPSELLPSTRASGAGQKSHTNQGSMIVVGAPSGQTWIGLYENGSAIPNIENENKMGAMDFVLDNLTIRPLSDKEVEEKVGVTLQISNDQLFQGETAVLTGTSLNNVEFTNSNPKVASFDEKTMTVSALSEGTTTITASRTARSAVPSTASVTITVSNGVREEMKIEGASIKAMINNQGGYSDPNSLLDGNGGTLWEGRWDGVTAENPAVVVIDLGKETSLAGFTLKQRNPANVNGMLLKYRFAAGNAYDESSKTITDAQMSEWIDVPTDKQGAGAVFAQDLPLADGQLPTVRYLRIEVQGSGVNGKNNNAAIADIGFYTKKLVATQATVEDVTIEKGQTAVLEAKPVGDTILKGLVWSTEDTDIIRLTANGSVTGLAAGEATVTASNAAGLKATAKVTVTLPVPAAPSGAQTADVTHNSAKITWQPAADKNVTAYVVKNGDTILAEVGAEAAEAAVLGLEAETTYELTLFARSADGVLSAPVEVPAFTTLKAPVKPETKPSAPTEVKTGKITHDSAEISWTAPADERVAGYVVKNGDSVLKVVEASASSAVVTGLKAETTYKLTLFAINQDGELSEAAAVPEFTTLKEPEAPKPQPEHKPGHGGDSSKPAKPGEAAKPAESAKPAVPQTGDESALLLWTLLAVVSIGGAACIYIYKKKHA